MRWPSSDGCWRAPPPVVGPDIVDDDHPLPLGAGEGALDERAVKLCYRLVTVAGIFLGVAYSMPTLPVDVVVPDASWLLASG